MGKIHDLNPERSSRKRTKASKIPFITLPGKAEEALNFYASVLSGAEIISPVKFEKGQLMCLTAF